MCQIRWQLAGEGFAWQRREGKNCPNGLAHVWGSRWLWSSTTITWTGKYHFALHLYGMQFRILYETFYMYIICRTDLGDQYIALSHRDQRSSKWYMPVGKCTSHTELIFKFKFMFKHHSRSTQQMQYTNCGLYLNLMSYFNRCKNRYSYTVKKFH